MKTSDPLITWSFDFDFLLFSYLVLFFFFVDFALTFYKEVSGKPRSPKQILVGTQNPQIRFPKGLIFLLLIWFNITIWSLESTKSSNDISTNDEIKE